MDDVLWFMPLIVALLLVICGTGVVKNPSILSNYSSFTDEEKSSPAFMRYLRDIRKAMCVTAAFLAVEALLDFWLVSYAFSEVLVLIGIFSMAFYLLYRQSKVSERMKRKSRMYAGFLLVVLLGVVLASLLG